MSRLAHALSSSLDALPGLQLVVGALLAWALVFDALRELPWTR